MNTGTAIQNPETIYGYDVIDTNGNKVGAVDGVWVDDATNRLEFVAVKTGWLFGKDHMIPVEKAQLSDHQIQVPFDQDQIKNGPSFPTDAELSADDEQEIYSYYGMKRSTAPSPTGMATGGPSTFDASGRTDTQSGELQTGGERDITLSEEELEVGKRQVQTGDVRLRKVVRTEHEEVPVELRREQVDIERVPATGTEVPSDAFKQKEIDVPVTREEPVVGKEARVTGQVRVGKDVETERRTVGGEIRREDVEVEGDEEYTDSDLGPSGS